MTGRPLSLHRARCPRPVRQGVARLGPWLALVLAIALAAPGAAEAVLAPAPTVVTFDDLAAGTQMEFASRGVTFTDGDNCADINPDARAHSGPNVLGGGPGTSGFTCNPMQATFSERQSYVSLFASHTQSEGTPAQGRATLIAYRTCPRFQLPSDPIDSDVADESSSALSPLSVADPAGSIACVTLDVSAGWFVIDDLSFSRDLQPDTEITDGPSGSTIDTSATFAFRANQAARFECALDGGPFEPCSSPRRLDGLATGFHTFRVRGVDVYGAVDPSPATLTWTVTAPLPAPLPAGQPDTDRDGVPDTTDNCGDVANGDQADRDRDGIGNACEALPPGDVPPVAGTTAVVKLVSGEVFVKLPPGAVLPARSRRALAGAAQAAPIRGFVPLKGVASVPVGATVDARKGRIGLTTAGDFRQGTRDRRLQVGTFAAALFRLRQQRTRKAARSSRPRTDLVMQTPPGMAQACAAPSAVRPIKGIVRAFAGSAVKGVFRTVGAASEATVSSNATWIVQDRCTGTLTEVGRGRAAVLDRARNRTVTVRPGQAYLARARLFGAKKSAGALASYFSPINGRTAPFGRSTGIETSGRQIDSVLRRTAAAAPPETEFFRGK
jgi:hypothetical protein